MRDELIIKSGKRGSSKLFFWILFAIGIFICACIGALYYFLLRAPSFRVTSFEVQGNKFVKTEDVRNALQAYINWNPSWIVPASDRVVYWYLNQITIENPQFLPFVDSISVDTSFFEKKVTAEVHERTMKGVWCSGDECAAFDEKGIAFSPAPDVSGSLILKIQDETGTPIHLGSPVFQDIKDLQSIMSAVEAEKRNNIPVSEVVVKKSELREWETVGPNGFLVRFSFVSIPDDLDSIFKEIKGKAEINTLTYIDLTVPDRAYFK